MNGFQATGKKARMSAVLTALLVGLLAACSAPSGAPAAPQASPPLVPLGAAATERPTLPPAPIVTTREPDSSASSPADSTPSPLLPSGVAAQPTTFPAPLTPTPAQTNKGATQVKIFLIALNDNGRSGGAVGCGDSVVGVQRPIPLTRAPLTAALDELLSLRDRTYGESGLYNALYQSNLQLAHVSIRDGAADIQLTGKLQLGGECDNPRVAAQLKSTVLQFPTVHAVNISLNGIPLAQVLSEK
jgi:hypothetical protein